MAAGILSLICLGGVGVFISLYDEATQIKRTAPDAVVSSYLRAFLVNRDDGEAALFMCKTTSDLSGMTALRAEMVDRERVFDVTVSVNWGTLTVSGEGDRRDVSTELTIAGSADGQSISQRTESWRFGVVDQDGWRVCGAAKVS
ncbi:hypothetical protein BG844_12715 [Couchioplanes caeruleus subsp. caeruleus]|uniref:Uncharacterized protein n=2 Tax=Couchioplanes caeruleus TaxID=56438 RepID=A0A1K0FM52_9ACTN|nr:hypothetical protein BG844_12715 [Couchioplanes caeruleus subsp. caeruleus]